LAAGVVALPALRIEQPVPGDVQALDPLIVAAGHVRVMLLDERPIGSLDRPRAGRGGDLKLGVEVEARNRFAAHRAPVWRTGALRVD
jgi:hypothetical protein